MMVVLKNMEPLEEALTKARSAKTGSKNHQRLWNKLDKMVRQRIDDSTVFEEPLLIHEWVASEWSDRAYNDCIIEKMQEIRLKAEADAEAEKELNDLGKR